MFKEPIINIYKIKSESVASSTQPTDWGDLITPSGTDDDEVDV